MKAFMEILAEFSQFILAVVGLWYSWETRKLRKQNEDELRLLEKQVRVSALSSLLPRLSPSIRVSSDSDSFDVIARNDGGNAAFDVFVLIHLNGRFFCHPRVRIRIGVGEKPRMRMKVSEEVNSLDEVLLMKIVKRYYHKHKSVFHRLKRVKKNYVFLIYRDALGHTYFTLRYFKVVMKKSMKKSIMYTGSEYKPLDF